ncbi:unnamed protein product, partial [Thlaspi arvense]
TQPIAPIFAPNHHPNNGFHMNPSSPSSPWSVSGFSDNRSPSSHMSPRPTSPLSYAAVVNGSTNGASSGSFSAPTTSSFSLPPLYSNTTCSDLSDEYVQDQFPFLDDSSPNNVDFSDPIMSPSGRSDSVLFPYSGNWVDPGTCSDNNHHNFHRRSCSVSDLYLGSGSDDGGSGLVGGPVCTLLEDFARTATAANASAIVGSPSKLDGLDDLLRMKAIQHQKMLPLLSLWVELEPFPLQQSRDGFDVRLLICGCFLDGYMLHCRSAAAALMMGDEYHKFGRGRPERFDFSALGLGASANSSSKQIYLTFPADSTFKEEDQVWTSARCADPIPAKANVWVCYLRLPETVKIILAKGNPHFVCDSRVLVKPYKEKEKSQTKSSSSISWREESFQRFFLYCAGARMFLNHQEMMLRRKLEQEAELQQAIEIQGRRLMNLQLMDLKNHHHHGHQFQQHNLVPGIPIASPAQPHLRTNQNLSAAATSPTAAAEGQLELNETSNNNNGHNSSENKEQCSHPENDNIHESLEHILPDNLFSSPKKSDSGHCSIFSTASAEADDGASVTASSSSNNTQRKVE